MPENKEQLAELESFERHRRRQDDGIPFNKPFMVGKELHYIGKAVAYSNISGDGEFTTRCCELMERRFGLQKVLLTHSCTGALEMSAFLCDLKPGDEVILPSYTFVSTANAFVRRGAVPVFVDIRNDTLNLDETLIERAITPRTKVIVPVHYAGIACEMDAICEIAERHGIFVVEDAAQGVDASYRGRNLGSFGHLASYSFHETKNYVCGEGGALCVNDPSMVTRAEIIRDKGTNRQQFFRGEVQKYTWVDVGSSYVVSEILAAFLYAQLEAVDDITERRKCLYEAYRKDLYPLHYNEKLRLPEIPPHCSSNYHMFYLLLPDVETRSALIEFLKDRYIQAIFHYVPLHSSFMGRKLTSTQQILPVTEDLSGRLLRLPFYHEMTEDDRAYVVESIYDFMQSR